MTEVRQGLTPRVSFNEVSVKRELTVQINVFTERETYSSVSDRECK